MTHTYMKYVTIVITADRSEQKRKTCQTDPI